MNVVKYISFYVLGFVLTGSLSKINLSYKYLLLLVTLSCCFRQNNVSLIKSMCLIGGVSYASLFQAKPWNIPEGSAVVVFPSSSQSGDMIVRSLDSDKRFLVHGEGNFGDLGFVECRSSRCFFSSFEDHDGFNLRLFLEERLYSHVSTRLFGWLSCIILGNHSYLNRILSNEFRSLGIYHLLVVSGMHISILSQIMMYLLLLPLRILYAARIFKFLGWKKSYLNGVVLSTCSVVFYVHLVGFSVSAQRVLILNGLFQCSRIFLGRVPLGHTIIVGVAVQSLLFPLNFVSFGTFMSWAAYLVLVGGVEPGCRLTTILNHFRQQLMLSVLSTMAFGYFSPWWMLVSFLVGGLFKIFMISGIVVVLLPKFGLTGVMACLHESFLDFISHLNSKISPPVMLPYSIRFCVVFLGCMMLIEEVLMILFVKGKNKV